MSPTMIQNDFGILRQLGLQGNESAPEELQQRYGSSLGRVIRRVIRKGRGHGELAEFILDQVAQLKGQHQQRLDPQELVDEILARLCALIAGHGVNNRAETRQCLREATVAA